MLIHASQAGGVFTAYYLVYPRVTKANHLIRSQDVPEAANYTEISAAAKSDLHIQDTSIILTSDA